MGRGETICDKGRVTSPLPPPEKPIIRKMVENVTPPAGAPRRPNPTTMTAAKTSAMMLLAMLAMAAMVKPVSAVQAEASHILVDTEAEAKQLLDSINNGSDFAEMARKHSKCPSKSRGGSLGKFGRGQMVKEFDTVVFNEEVGPVHGPVKTQFGYHLIKITSRA